jgi:hypothetical protein
MSDEELHLLEAQVAHVEGQLARQRAALNAFRWHRWFRDPGRFLGVFLGLGIVCAWVGAILLASAFDQRGVILRTDSRGGAQPILRDINQDGVEDIIALAWRNPSLAPALRAVAYDGKTYKMLWQSAAFAADDNGEYGKRLILVGDRLVVTDGIGFAHVLDAATGHTIHDVALKYEPTAVCVRPGGGLMLGNTEVFTTELDPASGKLVPVPDGAQCLTPGDPRALHDSAGLPIPQHPGPAPSSSYETNGAIVHLSYKQAGSYLSVVDKKTRQLRWVRPSSDLDEGSGFVSELAIGESSVHYACNGRNVQILRVTARSLDDGRVLHAREFPMPGKGRGIDGFTMRGERLFLTLDGSLHVLDARTGAELARLRGS